MRAIVTPSKAQGRVVTPPSKSMAHRVLIGAGLSEGTSIIRNIDLSEDIKATLGILEKLGCEYSMENHVVTMQGIGKKKFAASTSLDCKESGSTLRFFIPILLTGSGKCEFTGAKRLFERPLSVYEDICAEQNIFFEKTDAMLRLHGTLQAKHYRVSGAISSQFITGLLYALPLLEGDSILEILPPVESRPYIDMTLQALRLYGIQFKREKDIFYIPGNQTYRATDSTVEGDYSNAAFLDALSFVGGDVLVEGLAVESLQGDKIYKEYFSLLQEENPQMDISECPDLGPILMGLAATKHGGVFTGTRRLKIKESDRGSVMAQELHKFGVRVDVEDNRIQVYADPLQSPTEILSSHNDHRIAMTLTTLCTLTGGKIDGCEAVNKSFPNYYEKIKELGIQVEIED